MAAILPRSFFQWLQARPLRPSRPLDSWQTQCRCASLALGNRTDGAQGKAEGRREKGSEESACTSLDEFWNFKGKWGNHPESRATLHIQRRAALALPLPPFLFAHQIVNFRELQSLQQRQAPVDEEGSSSATPPEKGGGQGPKKDASGRLRPLLVNIVDSEGGQPVGCGLFHCRPLIAVRTLEGLAPSQPLDAAYVGQKLREAAERRRGLPRDAFCEERTPEKRLNADAGVRDAASPEGTGGSALRWGFYRLINGESDGLPGLVAVMSPAIAAAPQNRLNRTLVLPTSSLLVSLSPARRAWSELLTVPLLEALQEALRPLAVVLRNDSLQRQLERDSTMQQYTAVLAGEVQGWQWIEEGGVRFPVDICKGHETGKCPYTVYISGPRCAASPVGMPAPVSPPSRLYGCSLQPVLPRWYYDRREAREAVARLSKGAKILDLHCHSAAFSVGALQRGGARQAVCVDTSPLSLGLAEAAAAANNVQHQVSLHQADALEWLLRQAGETQPDSQDSHEGSQVTASARGQDEFDVVIMDPPSPHRRSLVPAFTADLQQLAAAAASRISKGGRLVVVDSSRFLELQQLLELLAGSIATVGRTGEPPNLRVTPREATTDLNSLKCLNPMRQHEWPARALDTPQRKRDPVFAATHGQLP
ncbi:dual specificity protein phosphatase [Cyclospora cayetanensis]|uniref:Dual specificity protein phosphatase n=1 Tax=Cyclospora cayetanensis TaxID=88456 RepID=A0A1D3CR72_9EIME|nr:dual specificity protein phosphatase [Cyclospora cayetanensis]